MGTVTLPYTLTAGQPENVNQLMSNLTTLRDALNGNIDTANLATSAKPVTLLGPYHVIAQASLGVGNGDTAGVYFPTLGAAVKSGNNNSTVANTPFTLVYLTGTDYAASGLAIRLRVTAATAVNATAPTVNFTFGLYPVTVGGAGTSQALTAGTVVSGSTVTRTAPSASTLYQDASADFAAPANGVYALGVNVSGATAANSEMSFAMRLEYHHV